MEKEVKRIVRIAGVDLDGSKKVEDALLKVPGISHSFARAIRIACKFEAEQRLGELSDEKIELLKKVLKDPAKFGIPSFLFARRKEWRTGETRHLFGAEVELARREDIKQMQKIRTYRGVRHALGYKVRGQRTKARGANIRGRVGPVIGVLRKKARRERK
jgi:small subunit ribosomal protein S13